MSGDHPADNQGEAGDGRPAGALGPGHPAGASVMIHMNNFDSNQESHVATMKKILQRLSNRAPEAGLVLQLGDKFYRSEDDQVQEMPWTASTPPPVVTRMSAVNLPRHGLCLLVEGRHLGISVAPTPHQDGDNDIQVQPRAEPVLPLVLYCIQDNVVQAEKLRPMFSTPDECKALFAAPRRLPSPEGTVVLRLRRGYAFSPDVTMTSAWLRPRPPQSVPA